MAGRKKIIEAPNGELTSPAGTEGVPVTGSKYITLANIAAYIRTLTQTLTGKTINLTDNTLTGTKAQFNTAMSDADFATLTGTETLTNKTLTTPTISGAITFPDNTRQTFNPGADAAGLNVGSHAGDPGTPSNGDLWYDSAANELTARINGSNVALGAGGSGAVATDTIWDAKGDLAGGTGANTAAKLTVGSNGQVLTADSAETTGMKWATPSGGGGAIVDYDLQRYTAGNITLNNTSWTDVSGPADLSVSASTGDLIEVGISCLWGSEALESYLDFATRVGGSAVNYVSGGTAGASNRGVVGWQSFMGPAGGGMNVASVGSIIYAVQAGDISGGTVTLRLRFRTSSASNKTLFATSDIPLHLFVTNYGQ